MGIKIRGEKGMSPLEMKVRKKTSFPCLEKWKKCRLAMVDSSCMSVEEHLPDILERLKGDKVLDGREDSFIRRGQFVEVTKSRTSIAGGSGSTFSLSEEFCLLKFKDDSPGGQDELWYSLCVEGPKDEIRVFLKRKEYIKDLMILLSTALVECTPEQMPVLGGYPTWIEVIGLKDHEGAKLKFISNFSELSSHIDNDA